MFCFACKLFEDSDIQSALTAGYSDWKNAAVRLAEHEGSESHRKAMLTYVTRCADGGWIDSELKKQFDNECKCWTDVFAVVKFYHSEDYRLGDIVQILSNWIMGT